MTLIQCDRCGKTLNAARSKLDPHFQIRKTTKAGSPFFFETKWRDLCDECSYGLEKWLVYKERGDINE